MAEQLDMKTITMNVEWETQKRIFEKIGMFLDGLVSRLWHENKTLGINLVDFKSWFLQFERVHATRLQRENSSLRNQVTLYEQKKSEIDSLIEKLRADLASARRLREQSTDDCFTQLKELKLLMQSAEGRIKYIRDILFKFEDMLNRIENHIKLHCVAVDIETGIVDIEKGMEEAENQADNVMSVHGALVGVYSPFYNVGSLLLQKRFGCKWSPWGFVMIVLLFAILLGLQVGLSYRRIKHIVKTGRILQRQLDDLRRDALKFNNTSGDESSSYGSTSHRPYLV